MKKFTPFIITVFLFVLFSIPVSAQFGGSYTINPSGNDDSTSDPTGGGLNYHNFQDVLTDLVTFGVLGPTVFEIFAGTYEEQLQFQNSITGTTSVNIITFKPEPSITDNTSVIVQNGIGAGFPTIVFNGNNNIAFKNMTIKNNSTSPGNVILFDAFFGPINNILFDGNIIEGSEVTDSDENFSVIRFSKNPGDPIDEISITNNEIYNGSIGIYAQAISGEETAGIQISNNKFENFYYAGVDAYFQDALTISGNFLLSNNVGDRSYGVSLVDCINSSLIEKNDMILRGTDNNYGIYLATCTGSSGNEMVIANNLVDIANGGADCAGIWVEDSYFVNTFYNTVKLDGGNGSSAAFYTNPLAGSSLQTENNIFICNNGAGYAIWHNDPGNVSSCNYNSLFSTGPNVATDGISDFGSVPAWSGSTGLGVNSVNINPLFVSPSDFHLNGAGAPNAGLALNNTVSVTTDFDGDTRSGTTPFIGADEFVVATYVTANTGNWNTPGTWQGGTIPPFGSNVDVEIKHNVTANVPVDIGELTVTGAGNLLVLSSNLKANGLVEIYGVFQDDHAAGENIFKSEVKVYTGASWNTNSVVNPANLKFEHDLYIDGTFTAGGLSFLAGTPCKIYGSTLLTATDIFMGAAGTTITNNIAVTTEDLEAGGTNTWHNNTNSILTVSGDFLLSNGSFNGIPTGNTVNYTGTGQTIKPANYFHLNITDGELSGTCALKGDLDITNISGASVFEFKGTVDQSINFSAGVEIEELTINKSSGVLSLNSDVITETKLKMLQGNVNTQGNTLTLGTSVVSEGTYDYTSGIIIGKFERWVANTGNYHFHIGTSTKNRRFVLKPNNLISGGTFITEFIEANPGVSGLPLNEGVDINAIFTEGFWKTGWGNGFNSNNYSLSLITVGMNSETFDANSRVVYRENSGLDWELTGMHSSSGTVPNNVNRSAISGLSGTTAEYAAVPAATSGAPMSGTYSINHTLATDYPTNRNFESFTHAVNALIVDGIDADVTFEVYDGVYDEQISIPEISGSSTSNNIIFVPEPNATSVTLQNNNEANNWVVRLDGADNIQFYELEILTTASTPNKGVLFLLDDINNSLNNIEIGGCELTGRNINDADVGYTIIYQNPNNSNGVHNLNIHNNFFSFGSNSIMLQPDNAAPSTGLVIENNTFENFYEFGVRLIYSLSPRISHNSLLGKGTSTQEYGIYLQESNSGFEVFKNNIELIGTSQNFGMSVWNSNSGPGNENIISNNMISTVNGSLSNGIYLNGCTFLNVFHNSTHIQNGGTTGAALNLVTSSPSDIRVLNNILVNSGGGYSIRITNVGDIAEIDYNDLFSPAGNVGREGANPYNTLVNWQGTGFDTNSLSIDPIFVAPNDLHLSASNAALQVNNSLAGVIDDIDDTPHGVNPYVGAHEFGAGISENALLFDGTDDFVNCGTSIDLSNKSFTIEFWAKRVAAGIGTDDGILGQHNDNTDFNSLILGFQANDKFIFAFDVNGNQIETSDTYTDTDWHHWACVFESGVAPGNNNSWIIRDGVEVASGEITSDLLVSSSQLDVGMLFGNPATCFEGEIDELRIWNGAANIQETQQFMCQAANTTNPNLIAYYDFNQTSGNILTDRTTNNHNGNLINMDDSDWVSSAAFTTWTGATSTVWTDPANWTNGNPGAISNNVGLTNDGSQPTLSALDETVNHIVFTSSTVFNNNSQTLFVNGNAYSSEAGGTNSGFIELTGGTSQQYIAGQFNSIETDNTNGIGQAGSTIITNDFKLTSGKVYLYDYNLIFVPGATLTGTPSSGKYFVAEHNGMFVQQVPSSTTRIFPIGTSAYYAPATFADNSGADDNYGMKIFADVTDDGNSTGATISNLSDCVNLTWQIAEENAGGADYDLTLQWDGTNPPEGATFTNANSAVGYFNSVWMPTTESVASGAGPFTQTITGVNTMTSFAVGDVDSPMATSGPPPGNALYFDDWDDYVNIGNGINLVNNTFTIEFWTKRNASGNDDFLCGQGSASNNNGLQIGFRSDNNFAFAFWGNDLDVPSSEILNPNGWNHWCCVYDASIGAGTDRWIYMNGVLVASDDASSSFLGSGDFLIGYCPPTATPFDGQIDEFRIWNSARTQAEIQTNMYTQFNPGDEANLVADYHFDQGEDILSNVGLTGELVDYSTNCNNGTLTNFSLAAGATSNWNATGNNERPILTNNIPTAITTTTATLNGEVFVTGESATTVRGFVYLLSGCPTLAHTDVNEAAGVGVYSLGITGLTPGTTYYVRSYATNTQGTSYGEMLTFTTLSGPMNGTYSIDGLNATSYVSGIPGGNFNTFTEAVAALISDDVNGAVIFDVADGTYDEQITIPAITGATATETITFQSDLGVAANVTLSNAPAVNNWVVNFDGASYIRFERMTISNTCTGASVFGRVFDFNTANNPISDIIIKENVINGRLTTEVTSGYYSIYHQASATNIAQSVQITNNIFYDGSCAIAWYGEDEFNYENSNLISGNTINNFHYMGITTNYQDAVTITNNMLTSKKSGANEYGIVAGYLINSSDISKNTVNIGGTALSYGIKINECRAILANKALVSNNFVSVNAGNPTAVGIVFDSSDYTDFYHNSVNLTGTVAGTQAMWSGGSSTFCNIANNILVNNGAGIALRINQSSDISLCDNNILFSNGTNLARENAILYADITAWRAATPFDDNSYVENPPFISATDLHLNTGVATYAESNGAVISLLDDIDDDVRFGEIGYGGSSTTAKDIGADEGDFTALSGGPMSGTYTIDKTNATSYVSGTLGGNFNSFTEAVAALVADDIDGAVIFDVATGTYDEQITIPAISGTAAGYTITFKSASNVSGDVTLQHDPSTNNWVVNLDGVDNIIFTLMTIKNTAAGRVFVLNNINNGIEISSCIVEGVAIVSTDNTHAAICNPTSSTSNIQILDNVISGGSMGVALEGSCTVATSNIISGNTINNFSNMGLLLRSQHENSFTHNTITSAVGALAHTIVYGIWIIGSNDKVDISNNYISSNSSSNNYGIYINNGVSTSSNELEISNNFVVIQNGGGAGIGIYVSGPYRNVYHNSVNIISAGASNNYSLFVDITSSDVNIQNNIFANETASGLAAIIEDKTDIINCNNNIFHASSDIFEENTVKYNTLATWQAATTFDSNSYIENPAFLSSTDLHLNTGVPTEAESNGANITVNFDIDGDARTVATPDIGADEGDFLSVVPIPPGNALNLDGTDDFVSVVDNASLNITDEITVEAWVYLPDVNSTQSIISKSDGTSGYALSVTGGHINFDIWDNIGTNYDPAWGPISASTWTHVAATRTTAGIMTIYIDGNPLSAIGSSANPLSTNPNDLIIGASASNTSLFLLDGMIDEARIWNKARTDAEILAGMTNQYEMTEPNLVANWRFDQGNPGVDNNALPNEVIDYTTSCNKGILKNFTLNGLASNWVETTNDQRPILTTIPVTNIAATTADCQANIFSIGSSVDAASQVGVVWTTVDCPNYDTHNSSSTIAAFGTGLSAVYNMTGLTPGTTYYVRAYSINTAGISYGETHTFTTNSVVSAPIAGFGYCVDLTFPQSIQIPGTTLTRSGNEDFTASFWFKTGVSGAQKLLTKHPGIAGTFEFEVGIDASDKVYFIVGKYGGAEYSTIISDNNVDLNVWTNVTVTKEEVGGETVMTLFINGLPVAKEKMKSTISTAIASMGAIEAGHDFIGQFDELSLWSVAYSQAEIHSKMSLLKDPTDGNLAGYWRFDRELGVDIFEDISQGVVNHAIVDGSVIISEVPMQLITKKGVEYTGESLQGYDFNDATRTFNITTAATAGAFTSFNATNGDFNYKRTVYGLDNVTFTITTENGTSEPYNLDIIDNLHVRGNMDVNGSTSINWVADIVNIEGTTIIGPDTLVTILEDTKVYLKTGSDFEFDPDNVTPDYVDVGHIYVKGTLIANGDETNNLPVIFDRQGASGNWGNIVVGTRLPGSVSSTFTFTQFTNGSKIENIDGINDAKGVLSINNAEVLVDSCLVDGNAAGGIFFTNVSEGSVVNSTISNNEFSGLELLGGTLPAVKARRNFIFGNKGHGIYVDNSSPSIKYNYIHNNNLTSGVALEIANNSSPQVMNNIIVNNAAGIKVTSAGSSPFLINNTIANNTNSGINVDALSSTTLTNSIIWGNGSGIDGTSLTTTFSVIQGVDSDPLFVSPSAGIGNGVTVANVKVANWEVQSTSSCINSGDPNTVITGGGYNLPYDFNWLSRVKACVIDIGAHEQQGFQIVGYETYNTWLGCDDSDWHNANNWSFGTVPVGNTGDGSGDDVYIPGTSTAPNQPEIKTPAFCRTIVVGIDALVEIYTPTAGFTGELTVVKP